MTLVLLIKSQGVVSWGLCVQDVVNTKPSHNTWNKETCGGVLIEQTKPWLIEICGMWSWSWHGHENNELPPSPKCSSTPLALAKITHHYGQNHNHLN